MPTTHAYAHGVSSEPLLGVTIDEMFRDVVTRFPSHEAFVDVSRERRLTYSQLDAEVQRTAKALLAMGVARGGRVGVWATDSIEWLLVQMATARIGAVLVNINPAYRLSELRHALRLARVRVVVTMPRFRSSAYVEMLRELTEEVPSSDKPQAQALGGPDNPMLAHGASKKRVVAPMLPSLQRVVVFDPDDPDDGHDHGHGFIGWPDFLAGGDAVPDEKITERAHGLDTDDPINIQFTSGTTGFPKGVVLTHHNILNNAHFVAKAMSFTERDRLCVPLPFYHCFGMVVSNLVCLTHGACVVVPADHFEPGSTLHAIEQEKCTAIHGVPTMFGAELDHPGFAKYDLSSLRTGIMAGAPCPPELMKRVMHDMGCHEILIGYGQTEASPIATLTSPNDDLMHRTETVGRVMPHQEVKVVDPETGRTLDRGEAGEICFRGHHVMRRYEDQPEETAKAIDERRWLHSGDLGVMHDDGSIAITGRLKDMIIRGGENIYPAEVEALYYEHPDIEEISVFGVADERLGETVGAWVRVREGGDIDGNALRAWGRDRMTHFKVPTSWWFVREFPMTVTGKIQKNRMRDAVRRWLDAGARGDVESFVV